MRRPPTEPTDVPGCTDRSSHAHSLVFCADAIGRASAIRTARRVVCRCFGVVLVALLPYRQSMPCCPALHSFALCLPQLENQGIDGGRIGGGHCRNALLAWRHARLGSKLARQILIAPDQSMPRVIVGVPRFMRRKHDRQEQTSRLVRAVRCCRNPSGRRFPRQRENPKRMVFNRMESTS